MINPFKSVPFITSPHLIAATAKSRCVIYLPVVDQRDITAKMTQLNNYLISQPSPPQLPKSRA